MLQEYWASPVIFIGIFSHCGTSIFILHFFSDDITNGLDIKLPCTTKKLCLIFFSRWTRHPFLISRPPFTDILS